MADEPPKDGSEQLFEVTFNARAYWDDQLKRWVLSYPVHWDYLPKMLSKWIPTHADERHSDG